MSLSSSTDRGYAAVRLDVPRVADDGLQAIVSLLQRELAERTGLTADTGAVRESRADELRITLAFEPGIGNEGFRIGADADNHIRIAGNDQRGLLYGVGKFLRSSRYADGRISPGAWRGTSVPACPVRTMYLTGHMMTFYEAAPLPAVLRYIEELALWGWNGIALHAQVGIEDPAIRSGEGHADMHHNFHRFREMFRLCKRLGLTTCIIADSNSGANSSTPEGVGIVMYPDDWKKRGTAGVKVCPSNPAGRAWLLSSWGKMIDAFADVPPDYICSWPYDGGGCGCASCWPWAARGFVSISRDMFAMARARFPACKFIFSTWMIDMPPCGEWEGLSDALRHEPGLADYILCDDDEDFPRYPLDKGVPGGLPLLNFPEITMWGMWPWGGYGANPMPGRFQRLWEQVKGRVAGGMPYSEGIWDNINAALVSQFYWTPDRPATDTLREYIAYEFSPDAVEPVMKAVELLEEAQTSKWSGPPKLPDAFDYLRDAEARLTPAARQSWRWRVLYLRGLLDRERYAQPVYRFLGEHWPTAACAPALEELVAIYHAQNAANPVRPPLRERDTHAEALPAPATAVRT